MTNDERNKPGELTKAFPNKLTTWIDGSSTFLAFNREMISEHDLVLLFDISYLTMQGLVDEGALTIYTHPLDSYQRFLMRSQADDALM